MKSLIGYAALVGALGLANAKVLKWSPDDEKRWSPPQETLGFMPALGMNGLAPPQDPQAPAPTSPPVLPDSALQARGVNNNTCGYLGGIRSSSMWCPTSQFCAYNSINSHIGCCEDTATSCNVWTTCLKSADSAKFTTDNGFTLWCGFSNYPNCLTHIYADPTATGYTLLGCGVAQGTDKIYLTAFDETSSSSSSSTTDATTTDSSSSSSSSTRTGLIGPNATNNPPVQQSSGGSSTPLGAIIGGAVGGVAALALIGFGIFFLVRANNKRKANIAPATAAAAVPPSGPGGPGGPGSDPTSPAGTTPTMAQHTSYYDPTGAGFAHLDPRASIAKPPYGYDQGVSPPASPPPQGQSPGPVYNNTPSPPPPGQQGYPQQQQYGQQQPGAYSPQGQYPPQTVAYAQPGQYSPQQQQQQGGQGYGFPQGQQQQQQQPQYQAYNPQQSQQPQHQFVHELPTQRGDGEVRELAG